MRVVLIVLAVVCGTAAALFRNWLTSSAMVLLVIQLIPLVGEYRRRQ